MLEDVKQALRITNKAYDGEVQDLIDAALADLYQSGVFIDIEEFRQSDTTDPLIKRAIITYCKAHFGYDNPDSERLNEAYIMLKQHLSLYSDYKGDIDA